MGVALTNPATKYANHGRAEKELKTALSLEENYAAAHYNLVSLYMLDKRYNEALQELTMYKKLAPPSLAAHGQIVQVEKRLRSLVSTPR